MNKQKNPLVMAMDSREFYELSQAYRFHPVQDPSGVLEAWEALKNYIIANSASALDGPAERSPVAWKYYNHRTGMSLLTDQPPDRVDFQHYKRTDYTITPLYAATEG